MTTPHNAQERITATVYLLCGLRGGLTQTDIAAGIGRSRSTISLKLKGERMWGPDDLDALAAFFDVPLDTFLRDLSDLVPAQLVGSSGAVNGRERSLDGGSVNRRERSLSALYDLAA